MGITAFAKLTQHSIEACLFRCNRNCWLWLNSRRLLTPRTGRSRYRLFNSSRFSCCNRSAAALGADDVYQWQLSFVGDFYGSYAALTGEVGNPGSFNIPAPASTALMGLAGLVAGRRKR